MLCVSERKLVTAGFHKRRNSKNGSAGQGRPDPKLRMPMGLMRCPLGKSRTDRLNVAKAICGRGVESPYDDSQQPIFNGQKVAVAIFHAGEPIRAH